MAEIQDLVCIICVRGTRVGEIVQWQGYEDHLVNWLVCDGREYDPAEYPELHEVLMVRPKRGRPYNPFGENRVPDLRARVIEQC